MVPAFWIFVIHREYSALIGLLSIYSVAAVIELRGQFSRILIGDCRVLHYYVGAQRADIEKQSVTAIVIPPVIGFCNHVNSLLHNKPHPDLTLVTVGHLPRHLISVIALPLWSMTLREMFELPMFAMQFFQVEKLFYYSDDLYRSNASI